MVVKDELRVHPRLTLSGGFLKIWIAEVAGIERAEAAHHPVGNQFDIAPGRNSFQAVKSRSLAEAAFNPVRNVGPESVFSVTGDAAIEDEAPLLMLIRGKAQALERNRHPNYKAAAGDFSSGIPNGVERGIEVALRLLLARGFGPDGVPLHAQWGRLKGVGATAVVEGVENDFDLIVVVDVFAAGHARAHFAGIIEADEHHVEILLVVTEISVGRLAHGVAVVRIALGESCDLRHLQSDVALGLHGQEIVERGRTFQARDGEGRRGNLRLGSGPNHGVLDRRLGFLGRRRRVLGGRRHRLGGTLRRGARRSRVLCCGILRG